MAPAGTLDGSRRTVRSVGERISKHARLNWQNLAVRDVSSPPFLILFINSICNMKCEHCFYWQQLNQRDDLTFDEIVALSEELGPIENLNLSGGEPFLRKEFGEICRQFIRQQRREGDLRSDQRLVHRHAPSRRMRRGAARSRRWSCSPSSCRSTACPRSTTTFRKAHELVQQGDGDLRRAGRAAEGGPAAADPRDLDGDRGEHATRSGG